MNRVRGCALLLFAGFLTSPVGAAARPQDDRQEHRDNGGKTNQRYDDKAHKDSHNWDNNEDTAWRQYRTEHHEAYRDFSHASKKEQSDYWNWRHEHSDPARH